MNNQILNAYPYHAKIISKFAANEWVKPTNLNSNDYHVFADLYEFGLVERRIEYKYRGENVLCGANVYFKYSA